MNGSAGSSPCGACKFLRRKCVKGCVFAPYFSHEQGAAHFAAIHKVFGASNVSKLLAHLPATERSEAAITISYEAQARLQDPIYGCVSQIFALQQQVVTLQAQLACLREQAASQSFQDSSNSTNPSHDNLFAKSFDHPQDIQSWMRSQNSSNTPPQFDQNLNNRISSMTCYETGTLNYNNPIGDHNNSLIFEGKMFDNEGGSSSMDSQLWGVQEDNDDLHSVAFRFIQHS